MIIKKIGHCCLIIEENGVRIMTDPGGWTEGADKEKNIDVVLITHEHQDHLHIPSVKAILFGNPGVRIMTNKAVGALLEKEGIAYELLEHGQKNEIKGVALEGFGEVHAEIYDALFARVQNTGYLVNGKLYYPGDSFFEIDKPVDILALPVCGPWMHIKECIDFAKKIKPRVCFPVHDGMLKHKGPFHMVPQKALTEAGINFVSMQEGSENEF